MHHQATVGGGMDVELHSVRVEHNGSTKGSAGVLVFVS
jgi:hypothetical protein